MAVLSKGPGTLLACAEQSRLNAAVGYIDHLSADEGEDRLEVGCWPHPSKTTDDSSSGGFKGLEK